MRKFSLPFSTISSKVVEGIPERFIAFLAVAGIIIHLIFRWLPSPFSENSLLPLYAVLAIGGIPMLGKIAGRLFAREMGADVLAGISILLSIFMQEYLVGSIMVLMLSGGSALERFATGRASSVLDALARRMPKIAHRRCLAGIEDIDASMIQIGDQLVVFPHELCPVDGIVIEGHGIMDESYLTGEPFHLSKTPGSQVLSGAINGEQALTVTAQKKTEDSRYASIMKVMSDAETQRPQLRRLGDQLALGYTPLALTLGGLAWVMSGDPHRFLAVLVVATPCPLLIAIPIAVIGAISLAASRGIVIKRPAILEQLTQCRTVILDKTGTLTFGKPSLTDIHTSPGFSEEKVLQWAASLEQYSRHPLAGAIVSASIGRGIVLSVVEKVAEKPGVGLSGIVDGRKVLLTGRKHVDSKRFSIPPTKLGLECLVVVDDQLAAAFNFHDRAQPESRPFLEHLPSAHGIQKLILVSGDREEEVRWLADSVGIKNIAAGKSPEEKVSIVRAETLKEKTIFIGDGINDAPALAAATAGVAIGAHSDITTEAAGAVIMTPTIGKLDELLHIGHRMRKIALQSALIGMGMSLLGMLAAAAGYLPPLEGAIAQEAIDLFAVLNAIRASFSPDRLTDY